MSSVEFDLNIIVCFLAVVVGSFIGRQIAMLLMDYQKFRNRQEIQKIKKLRASVISEQARNKGQIPLFREMRSNPKSSDRIRRPRGRTAISLGLVAVLVASVIATAVPAQRAGATPMSACSDSATLDMPNWSWDYWVTANNSSGPSGGNIGWFNSSTSSYIISSNGYSAPFAGQVTDVIFTPSSPNSRLVLYMTGGQEYVSTTDNSNVISINVTGRITGISYAFDRSIGATGNSHQYNLETYANSVIGRSGHTPDCISAVNNVLYDPSFTDPQYTAGAMTATHGVNDPGNHSGCSGILDITCYAANLYSGITTNIGQAFSAFTTGLYVLFVPSDTTLSTEFATTESALAAKLGFLTWPFSFAGSVWTAFTTPTTTCCTVMSGTFLGGHFEVNIAQWQTTAPAAWTLFTSIIKGTTIIGLFFALRNKYLEITSR